MRGRYLVRSSKAFAILSLMDIVLSVFRRPPPPVPNQLSRIVVANGAHLGDMLITLPAIAALRKTYPNATLGVIAGSWTKPVVEWSGLVDEIHIFDHWSHNRKPHKRWTNYVASRRSALAELRDAKYEVGIDFYPFFPPTHPLFYAAGIPIRIGFDSGGFGPLLTHSVAWRNASMPIAEHLRDLLACIPNQLLNEADLAMQLQRPKVLPRGLESDSYIVIHPGTGASFKEWEIGKWRQLIALLHSRGERLVLTGAGERDQLMSRTLSRLVDLNLVGQLNWKDYAEIIGGAKAVICPDTVAGHLAALFQVPTVAIFTGTNELAQWAPNSPFAKTILASVPCAPCHRPGCDLMTCIRESSVETVLAALDDLKFPDGRQL